jgi:hypothetical protein
MSGLEIENRDGIQRKKIGPAGRAGTDVTVRNGKSTALPEAVEILGTL